MVWFWLWFWSRFELLIPSLTCQAEWNKWMGYKMATAHTYYLDLIERVYAVSRARGGAGRGEARRGVQWPGAVADGPVRRVRGGEG